MTLREGGASLKVEGGGGGGLRRGNEASSTFDLPPPPSHVTGPPPSLPSPSTLKPPSFKGEGVAKRAGTQGWVMAEFGQTDFGQNRLWPIF